MRVLANFFPTDSVSGQNKAKMPESGAQNFSSMLEKAIGDVDHQIKAADQKIEELFTGKNKDIHGTMLALEKADLSIKMLTSLRNKAVAAYQEIYRMQV